MTNFLRMDELYHVYHLTENNPCVLFVEIAVFFQSLEQLSTFTITELKLNYSWTK